MRKKEKMVEKTRGKCFDCYFYKSSVWDDIFAKHVVWAAKNAIFSSLRRSLLGSPAARPLLCSCGRIA
jgi:hypothetical protein